MFSESAECRVQPRCILTLQHLREYEILLQLQCVVPGADRNQKCDSAYIAARRADQLATSLSRPRVICRWGTADV